MGWFWYLGWWWVGVGVGGGGFLVFELELFWIGIVIKLLCFFVEIRKVFWLIERGGGGVMDNFVGGVRIFLCGWL